jgi:hypothetical protein
MVLELKKLVEACGPEELHSSLREAEGVCFAHNSSNASVAAATNAEPATISTAVVNKEPVSGGRLTPAQLKTYKELRPTVLVFKNATKAEGSTLKCGQVELLLPRKLMIDGEAN